MNHKRNTRYISAKVNNARTASDMVAKAGVNGEATITGIASDMVAIS